MRQLRYPFLAIIIVLCAGRVYAAEVFTPVLESGSAGGDLECHVLNTSGKDIVVDVDIVESFGLVLSSTNGLTIPSGRAGFHEAVGLGNGQRGYCQVSGKFPKKKVIVTLCAEPDGVQGCAGGVVTTP